MEIQELKSHLNITEVALKLGIHINKQNRAKCPFHNDKTPSLQFSKEKNICTCFSTNCTAGTMDVIGLTEKYKNITTHEALKYLSELAGSPAVASAKAGEVKAKPINNKSAINMNYLTDFEQMQSSFISSSTARNYAESRGLNWKARLSDGQALQIGYNAFKASRFNYLRGCITFALRDKQNNVVSMYGRSIRDNDKAKHYYTSNRKGLYPNYPPAETTKLILTESVIDTATLLQIPELTEQYFILALYGTNGLTAEHVNAIQQLESLEEIILFFDGDEAGRAANEKQGDYLQKLFENITISIVETPEEEDINSLSIGHEPEIFNELLKNRKPFLFSIEKEKEPVVPPKQTSELNTSNPYKITYPTETATYHVKGGIPKALDSLKITLEIEHPITSRKSRTKPDLYEDKQVEKVSREAGEKLGIRADLIEIDLSSLTDLLDEYREQQLKENQLEEENQKVMVPIPKQQRCISFLKQKELIQKFNQLIEKSGITGEANNRIFLFVIATAYKMPDTLHALIQGSSGSGKTYLSRQITDLMPKEDVIRLTRVTESSFYNYGEYELQYKLIVLEDVDGLKEEAEFAFRELQSNNEIISSTSAKDENNGNIKAQIKKVKGPIGSIATTTRGEIYEDNMSRIFLLAVDESKEQTNRIIEYQNRKAAGMINKAEEIQTKQFIQNCIRMLKPYEVINPFANKILLPQEAHKIRRLTELFHAFVNQVTLLNQYQRQRDKQGRLITEKEDVQTAIEIMFDSIILKIDELDGSLRQFYEDLKAYIIKQGEEYQNYQFTQREIRQAMKISKTQIYRYFNDLINLEYIAQTGGYANRGFSYKITYWDDIKALRDRIKSYLNNQLETL
jgi:DNA primase